MDFWVLGFGWKFLQLGTYLFRNGFTFSALIIIIIDNDAEIWTLLFAFRSKYDKLDVSTEFRLEVLDCRECRFRLSISFQFGAYDLSRDHKLSFAER